jgi:hypothetical protein
MSENIKRARPQSSRYVAASIAQYLHELSGRHADERRAHEHAAKARPAAVALAGR